MAQINRGDVATLIQEEYSNDLLTAAAASSTVLAAFPTVNMGTKLTHLPVLATLPEAGWVTEAADATGVKPTSTVTWADKTLVAEEVAVIIPVHEDVVADATVDILGEIANAAGTAIARKLDEAVLFGIDKPATWTSLDLLAAAVAAGQTENVVDGAANALDLWGAINTVAGEVAQAGFNPSTLITGLVLRFQLANLRDADGRPVFSENALSGYDTYFNNNGAWQADEALAFVVDPSRVRIGVRQDVTVKFLDQATVGGVNLAERDMVALRFKARYAYVLGSGTTPVGLNGTPVGAVLPAAPVIP